MNHLISQIKYFKKRKKQFVDPLKNCNQISIGQGGDKIKILYRQMHQSQWKYCIAPVIFNSILYTFVRINRCQKVQPFQRELYIFNVEICLEALKENEKCLFQNISNKQLLSLSSTISSLSSETFIFHFKNLQTHQPRISFQFKTKYQSKSICDKILKTSFFCFFFLIERLKIYHKIKKQCILSANSDSYILRYSAAAFKSNHQKNANSLPIQMFKALKEQEKSVNKYTQIVTLKVQNLIEHTPQFCFTFSENILIRDLLKKKYLKQEEEKKKILKKQKIFSNIEIEKQQSFKGFRIQTKFSIITQCSLVFKIIQTHMNRRHDFKKSSQNIEYFNYLVNITKTQSTVCVRKKPLNSFLESKVDQRNCKQGKNNENELKQKAKRILKTQKNCLDIMKESMVANICPYYVYYKQQDTLYSKMFRTSLQQWRCQRREFKDENILDIFLQILNGLNEMANHRIIHRDLKPDNILIDDSDPFRPIVKLIDFGSTIYIHEDSEKYQQEVTENFDPRLRTTKPYNIDFNEFRKMCYFYSPNKLNKYTESSYNRHANFDMHSFGKIMEDFLPKIKNENIINNLKFLISLCTSPDPEFRLNLQETGLFISTIKFFSSTS